MGVRITELDQGQVHARRAQLAAFEARFRYPLGDDSFRIDHGADYLAFFRCLGAPRLFAALAGDDVVGVLVAVERRMPEPVWYLGDLKVDPARRSLLLSARLLAAFERVASGAPAYGISMDPPRGGNRTARAATRVPGAGVRIGARLVFFSLDLDAWQRAESSCREALGTLGWVDHRGRKDIVLESTGAPMALLHLQHGPLARFESSGPRPGHVHMLCLPQEHALAARLVAAGHAVSARATLVERGLAASDWSSVLTSEI